jgi:hypothetical protein
LPIILAPRAAANSKNQSLLLDAIIVFETIKIVMFGRGGR